MKKYLLSILLLLAAAGASAQVVTENPQVSQGPSSTTVSNVILFDDATLVLFEYKHHNH